MTQLSTIGPQDSPSDILIETPLPKRLQALIDDFHAAHPDHIGPVIYVMRTGYAKLSATLFDAVSWPNPDSRVYFYTEHSQILWALLPPFFAFQKGVAELEAPTGYVIAIEKLPEAKSAWFMKPVLWARGIKARMHRMSPAGGDHDFLAPLAQPGLEPSNAIAVLSNFSAGGAERQASIAINALATAPEFATREIHAFSYAPASLPPHEQFFGKKLKIPRAQIHDISAVDGIREPYILARELGMPLDWGASMEEKLACALAEVDPNAIPFVEQFFWALIRVRPKIVFCWQDYMNTVGGYAACLAGAEKIVLFTRNVAPDAMGFHQPFFRAFYQNLLKQDRVTIWSNSHAGALSYAHWLESPAAQFQIIYNAFVPEINKSTAEPTLDLPRDGPTIIGVFKLRPEKDPALFVRVIQKVREEFPDIRAIHLGDGPLEGFFKEQIARAGLQDCIKPLGLRQDVDHFLRQSDLMLHTALTEGLPNVFLEAQYQGVPIVTTKAGGTIEAILPGVTGDELESRDPEIIARFVIKRLRDHDWREAARQIGPRFVAETFSEPQIMKKLIRHLG